MQYERNGLLWTAKTPFLKLPRDSRVVHAPFFLFFFFTTLCLYGSVNTYIPTCNKISWPFDAFFKTRGNIASRVQYFLVKRRRTQITRINGCPNCLDRLDFVRSEWEKSVESSRLKTDSFENPTLFGRSDVLGRSSVKNKKK